MTKLIQINSRVSGEEAGYKEQVMEEYKNNPFIEALPDIFDKEEVIKFLTSYPSFQENERFLDAKYRLHIIQRIFQYFQPLSVHLDLESKISIMIRQGYIARNPFSKEYIKGLNEGNIMIKNKRLEYPKIFSTSSYGMTIIGDSGMGKTVSVNKVLSAYPQVIIHSEYKGVYFSQYQVVWLKIDCPHDGSIKGLCLDFLMKIDGILGTSYYNSSKNYSTNTILPVICQIASRCSIGIIAFDEIQNLSLAKSGGSEKMLNFFMTLINNIKVPLLFIGTNKAMSILQGQFRQARRSAGQGTVFFERIKNKNESSWKLFAEGMFDYQWLKKPCLLTQELSDALYEESQGILDVAVKIFVMAQIRAIVTKKEEISLSLIKYTAKENLRLLRPMLDALKSGNLNKIAQYEDIAPLDISEFMDQYLNKINIDNKILEMQQSRKKNSNVDYNVKEEAILKLLELDITPVKAKNNVELVINSSIDILNVNDIVKQAYKLIINTDSKECKKDEKKKSKNEYSENDLRQIIQEGKKEKLSTYESLMNKGYIRPYLFVPKIEE